MSIYRRSFLQSFGTATLVAAVRWPASAAWLASPNPAPSREPIRLDSTGSAYGPFARVRTEMMHALSIANRFPDTGSDLGFELARSIAEFHSVNPSQVLIGCGSTEAQRSAVFALLGSGKRLVMAQPTFDVIAGYARSTGAEVIAVPLNRDFGHDLDAMLAASTSATRLVYVCNPNNPTGTLTYRKDLEIFIRKLPANTYVIIDEAYHDFAARSTSYESFIDYPIDDPRVIVTRTFSKIYGLAGLRIGYAISAVPTIEKLRPYKLRECVNVVAAKAALAALRDTEGLKGAIKQNEDARQEFENQAVARMLRPLASHTNFAMLNSGHLAWEVTQHFKQHNIVIGSPYPGLENYVRISLGRPEQLRMFWQVWDLKMFHPEAH